MIVKLLTEHHLEFLSFKGAYTDSSESTTLVKTIHCWKHMSRLIYILVLVHYDKTPLQG